MGLTLAPATESSINIISLMGEADKASNDAKKDVRVARKSAHLERMGALEENIDSMEDQRDQMKSNGLFNFVIGMVSNFLNMATQIISFACPPAAPIANMVNQTLQGAIQGLSQYKNGEASEEQMDSEIEQQKFMKIAEDAQNRYSIEDEFYKSYEQSGNTVDQRLEASLQNMMKAQDAAVRA